MGQQSPKNIINECVFVLLNQILPNTLFNVEFYDIASITCNIQYIGISRKFPISLMNQRSRTPKKGLSINFSSSKAYFIPSITRKILIKFENTPAGKPKIRDINTFNLEDDQYSEKSKHRLYSLANRIKMIDNPHIKSIETNRQFLLVQETDFGCKN
ncbi:Hypothetical_protein [Hexamita inflata]|uniref:Hypothetical_protein n=1 Tax=Hexamita inflata TaxID=28002 RepID=A0ABP1M659_9EUKA